MADDEYARRVAAQWGQQLVTELDKRGESVRQAFRIHGGITDEQIMQAAQMGVKPEDAADAIAADMMRSPHLSDADWHRLRGKVDTKNVQFPNKPLTDPGKLLP